MTALGNDKMSPALRARIERSVRRGESAGASLGPRGKTATRALVVMAVLAVATAVLFEMRSRDKVLQLAKRNLLRDVAAMLSRAEPHAARTLTNATRWLSREAAAYRGDVRVETLATGADLDALLARPALYLRTSTAGVLGAAAAGALALQPLAAASTLDSFVSCLRQPPEETTERGMYPHVRAVQRGQHDGSRFLRRYRFADLFAMSTFDAPRWTLRVRAASRLETVVGLRRQLQRANLDRSVAANNAQLLLFVLDEPKRKGVPSELDGASRHAVRMGIVQIDSGRVLLRLRRHVDPAWISETRRVYMARGLLACRLAMRLRDTVSRSATPETARHPLATVD